MYNILISLNEIEKRSYLAKLIEIEFFKLIVSFILLGFLAVLFVKQAQQIPTQYRNGGSGFGGLRMIIDEIIIMMFSAVVAIFALNGNVTTVVALIEFVALILLGAALRSIIPLFEFTGVPLSHYFHVIVGVSNENL